MSRRNLASSLADLTIASKSAHRREVRKQGYVGAGAGLAVGLVLGAAAALLLAPQSGKETRDQIAETGVKTYNAVKERGTEIIATAKEKGAEAIEVAKEKGAEMVETVKETGARLAQRVKGVEEECACTDEVVCVACEPAECCCEAEAACCCEEPAEEACCCCEAAEEEKEA